ncbi:MAG: MATE family efflux transporter [Ardenticatenaceae bacterium]|nr:MATE family efflux transporter [Anaerolineales bacterium]MCB8921589.1 MATE family efflux transporter [Ardenticatenaceae bacterium]MCB9003874.1 MATE family efflux transporter [Ardenticatenaceae bacterium]
MTHSFVQKPHRTVLALSVPVLFSLIAEPLTGLIDTAFIARLGAVSLAALGVGTAALSSVFWIFNFLGVGTQTEVAQALGRQNQARAMRLTWLALALCLIFGVMLIVLGLPLAPAVAALLGADGVVQVDAVRYMQIRLFGAPAVLAMLTAFGALRGMQDMRTPLWIATAVNALNIALDWLLIFGVGAVPAMGVAGAAAASAIAQWVGALWAVTAVARRLGLAQKLQWREAGRLLQIGGDLFVRTGLLTLYLLFTTRVATQIGADSGAVHQAIRQVWTFTALGLDALAVTAQSLVGYFMGANDVAQARRVAAVTSGWSVVLGLLLTVAMFLGEDWVRGMLVPETAVALFNLPWLVAAAAQPINALAFITDGIHWGTGDYRYLRNGMLAATLVGVVGLWLVDANGERALLWVWGVTAVWISVRALFGVLRIWPGIGQSPMKI